VYFDVGVAILAERWRSPPPGGSGKERWGNESTLGRRRRRRSGGFLREERKVEDMDMDMVLPIGRVNYATLIRPLEPVSEWRGRRGGASGSDLDLDLD